MPNELDYDKGVSVSLHFISANLATGAGIVDMTLAQGGTGYLVPAGYKFHPLSLFVTKTGTLDAGAQVDAQVIDEGTEIGAKATLTQSPDVARANTLMRVNQAPVAAGRVVGVSLTKNASYNTTATIDYDAILTGVLLPA